MSFLKWLGVEDQIRKAMAPALSSLEARLTRLAQSQDALKAEVSQIKLLIEKIVRPDQRC